MLPSYDPRARKRPVNLSLNEDLVRVARMATGNLSERVEQLLTEFVLAEQIRQEEASKALAGAIDAWNAFGDDIGSFADQHTTL